MASGTGITCPACDGKGQVTISGTVFTCPACLGTGEQPGTIRKAIAQKMPNICAVCRCPYPGSPHYVAGLRVCRDDKCIEEALRLWG